ncbi:MAG TPA: hypothetical protein VF169_23135 [Albitalea sp.]|uniref:hypothetical protein n=1 Tax=Piscinibacter sp. TaxID=1903157 RepID=UPI002ED2FF67
MPRDARQAGVALCAAAVLCAHAGGLQPMADEELSGVRGSDGLAFNLRDFSLSGPLTLTYTSPAGASLWLGKLELSRSDDPASTFSDPYRLRVLSRGNGLADVIQLTEPANASGLLKWQFAADWGVNADGTDFQGGALRVQDLVTRGGSVTLTTPATPGVEGIAFGLALQADIGHVLLRPRGRDDASEQLRLSGVRLGAVSDSGVLLGTPWAIADATNQPGIFNAVTEANGQSYLHLGIGWPTTSAPIGGLAIDSMVFKSDSLPGGSMDLGSSRVGTMQIQYLDVKLKAGF